MYKLVFSPRTEITLHDRVLTRDNGGGMLLLKYMYYMVHMFDQKQATRLNDALECVMFFLLKVFFMFHKS
jgi:hypothetical protein